MKGNDGFVGVIIQVKASKFTDNDIVKRTESQEELPTT